MSAVPAGTSSPTATATPSLSARPDASVVLKGTLRTTELLTPDQSTFFADLGALYAVAARNSPAPYASKIQRFDAPSGTWRDVFADDAAFVGLRSSAGHAVITEYREPPQGGGASDEVVLIVDLASGAATRVDAYALSAKTYHGGGGGPRRPSWSLALGANTLAWTRLNEMADGTIEGELRAATVGDTSHFTTVGRSQQWIEAVSVDDTTLVYVLGAKDRDELHVRDLKGGADRSVAMLRSPGVSAGRGGIARSGDLVAWIDNPPVPGAPDATPGAPTTSVLHTVDLHSGVTRELDLRVNYCGGLSGNEIGLAWFCSGDAAATSLSYFDPRTWNYVDIVRAAQRPNSLECFAGAFLWFDLPKSSRRVNLLSVAP